MLKRKNADNTWVDVSGSSLPAYDDVTINQDSNNKLQVKDSAISDAKLSPLVKSTAIPASGAVDTKLATEKAVKDFGDTKVTQYSIMPNAGADYENKIVQFIGTTTSDFVNGYFYKCVNDGGIYYWQAVTFSDGEFVPQLDIFPEATSDSPISFQYVGDETGYDKFLHYKKVGGNYAITCSFGDFYSTVEPPEEPNYCTLYDDEACTVENTTYKATNNGATIIVKNITTEETATASLAGGSYYEAITQDSVTVTYSENEPTDPKDGDLWVDPSDVANTYSKTELYNRTESDARYLTKSGGTMTGALTLMDGTLSTKNSSDNGFITINGGTNSTKGAYLQLVGKDHASSVGNFVLTANNGTTSKQLIGKPDGTLTWNDRGVSTHSTTTPTLTVRSGWTMWGQCTPIAQNAYYLNYTFRNDTGSAQGSGDVPIADVASGNAWDGAFATACFENTGAVIACVMQTNVLKFRSNSGVIPIGAYIPVSGIVIWTP